MTDNQKLRYLLIVNADARELLEHGRPEDANFVLRNAAKRLAGNDLPGIRTSLDFFRTLDHCQPDAETLLSELEVRDHRV